MPYVKTRAIILKVYDYSETSQIAAAFSAEMGRVQVLAKGAKRPKGPFGGVLEPLTMNELGIITRRNTTLYTLSDRALVEPYRSIRRDLRKLYPAMAGAELILASAPEMVPNPELFSLFDEFLAVVSGQAGERLALMAFLLGALRAEGFAPVLDRCVVCGKKRFEKRSHVLSSTAGGVVCGKCRSPAGKVPEGPLMGAVMSVSDASRRIMVQLARTKLRDAARIKVPDNFYLEIKGCLVYYIKSVIERGLRVLEESGGIGGL